MTNEFNDDRLTSEDIEAIHKAAVKFGVPRLAAYLRSREISLLSYQLAEKQAEYEANMKVILAHAIADGFSNGNEQYRDASDAQRRRYDMAADAVLKEMAALRAAGSTPHTAV